MIHYRDIIEYYLHPKEAIQFASWAFGEDFKNIPQCDIWNDWNERHSGLLKLDPTGIPTQDLPKMIFIWNAQKNKQESLMKEKMKPKQKKMKKVMEEFKEGKLHSGSKEGPKVKSRDQAIAIGMSEAGLSKKKK
jgi:hypothetical protein